MLTQLDGECLEATQKVKNKNSIFLKNYVSFGQHHSLWLRESDLTWSFVVRNPALVA